MHWIGTPLSNPSLEGPPTPHLCWEWLGPNSQFRASGGNTEQRASFDFMAQKGKNTEALFIVSQCYSQSR